MSLVHFYNLYYIKYNCSRSYCLMSYYKMHDFSVNEKLKLFILYMITSKHDKTHLSTVQTLCL